MIYSSLQGISGVQEWKQFSEYLLSSWWWPSPSQLELFSADEVSEESQVVSAGWLQVHRGLFWLLGVPCIGQSLLLPWGWRCDFVCRSWWPQPLWQEWRAAVPGQEQRQLELQKLGQRFYTTGTWAATKGLCLEKGGEEAEEQRAARFSSWVSNQILFQCDFHPQSSHSLVEESAFAVVQLGHIVLPCGWI